MSKSLAAALARLLKYDESAPSSLFTRPQQQAIEDIARRTRAVSIVTAGRGVIYRIVKRDILVGHLRELRPMDAEEIGEDLPRRAANIAFSRDTKSGKSGHDCFYLLAKAISDNVSWHDAERQRNLDLSMVTQTASAGVLALNQHSDWESESTLWLVENQELFDDIRWLPADATGTLAYYQGQLPTILLNWLAGAPRCPRIIFFPDYDGVGLKNYARLKQASATKTTFFMIPGWESMLVKFGNREIWLKTQDDFVEATQKLAKVGMEDSIAKLCQAMKNEGRALEHEAIALLGYARIST